MRQPARHRAPHDAVRTALAAELVARRRPDPALKDRAVVGDVLADDDQAEVVETGERGQVRRTEGSVVQRRGLSDGSV